MAALLCKKSSSLPLRFLNFMKKLQKQDDSSSTNIYTIRSTVAAFNSCAGCSADEEKDMFEAWMIEHKKVYNTLEEKEKRFQIYKENKRYIEEHNSTGNSSVTLGLNLFSDYTNEEISRMYCSGIDFQQLQVFLNHHNISNYV